ncbi:MAG: sigma-54 dependent transcriptional regulator [Syntrophobacteraceae bacterium]|nr:sigma-54 dependent transcriptional regulator [Syntrophobacteraceae bacterium]
MSRLLKTTILIADDDRSHRLMLTTMMDEWGFDTAEACDGEQALDIVRSKPVDMILMDMRMPKIDGIEATRAICSYNPSIPIVIVTAYSSIPTAVEAVKSGAFDYVTKPIDFDTLRVVMERALEHTRLRDENESLRGELARFQTSELTGASPAMQKLLEMIALVAPTDTTVLITGESGTGKGLIARAIHANSARREKPLIEVNCAAIPETLIESELFGHEKGAFTGADKQRKGRFTSADSGTIFLDEIGELPLPMQAKLLRAIQEGEIQRVGSDGAIPVDVRVIAATNRNIEKMVKEGLFREDLFYRLNVFALAAPPLRERVEDIPALAQGFLARFSRKSGKVVRTIPPRAMDLLLRYTWPGNVRELENAMERAVILLRGDSISPAELPLPVQAVEEQGEEKAPLPRPAENGFGEADLACIEKQAILNKLQETAGNKSEAARRLGITRRTLKLKLKKYGSETETD